MHTRQMRYGIAALRVRQSPAAERANCISSPRKFESL